MAFEEFQEFRKILCVCPECGKIVRLSDLKLKTKAKTEDTWLDYYEYRERLLSGREAEFDAIKGDLRAAAVAEGRKQAEVVFNQAIKQDFRKMKYDPTDIKPVLNPVDFVVFQDMNKKEEITDLVFLSKKLKNPIINKLRTQVKASIKKKNYEWLVARIDNEGKIEFE
jgi:predicted Holliday junction resolvase-like endonuclease